MDPEAVATLQLVKEPIGVVSVCGRARQGKSFILNQGTHSTQIFSLAILLSSMFIYNQGTHSTQIFSLAVLLSSMFIYNQYYRRKALMEADILIHSMETRLRAACNASDAKIDNVAKVLDALLSEYEKTIQGPGKWQKVAVFLQQSFDGPVLDLIKRQIAKVESEKSSHALQCRLIEDKMALLMKRLEASEGEKSKYVKRYQDAINEKKKLTDEYMNRTTDLQTNRRSSRNTSLLKTLDSTKQKSMDWKRKYEQLLSRQKAEEDQASSEIAALKSMSGAAEARLAAAKEQAQSAQMEAEKWKRKAQSAQVEAEKWKRKYDIAIREAKSASGKPPIVSVLQKSPTVSVLQESPSVFLKKKKGVT